MLEYFNVLRSIGSWGRYMDENTLFEIHPLNGVNNVSFGMSPSLVAQEFGVPESKIQNHLNQLVEFRSFMNVAYSDPDLSLCHVGFGRQMSGVFLGGVNLFGDPPGDVLKKLIDLDGEPYLYLGFVVFLRIGISLTGFHDDDIDQKSVTLFAEGAWHKRINKMTRFGGAAPG